MLFQTWLPFYGRALSKLYIPCLYTDKSRDIMTLLSMSLSFMTLNLISLFYLSNINQSIAKIDTSPIQVWAWQVGNYTIVKIFKISLLWVWSSYRPLPLHVSDETFLVNLSLLISFSLNLHLSCLLITALKTLSCILSLMRTFLIRSNLVTPSILLSTFIWVACTFNCCCCRVTKTLHPNILVFYSQMAFIKNCISLYSKIYWSTHRRYIRKPLNFNVAN